MLKEAQVLDAMLNFLIPADLSKDFPSGAELFDKRAFLDHPPAWFKEGVLKVNDETQKNTAKDFSDLKYSEQQEFLILHQRKFSVLLNNLMVQLIDQYYQNDLVRKKIGYGDTAPFPEGHEIIQGDVTLLENVYLKGAIYREIL